jgi:hypothetical protein
VKITNSSGITFKTKQIHENETFKSACIFTGIKKVTTKPFSYIYVSLEQYQHKRSQKSDKKLTAGNSGQPL